MASQKQLELIRRYTDHALRSLGSIYIGMGAPRIPNEISAPLPKDWEAHYLINDMRSLAVIIAYIEGATDERGALRRREDVMMRYIELARKNHGS